VDTGGVRSRYNPRAWPIAGVSRSLAAYLIVTDVVALVWAGLSLPGLAGGDTRAWWVLVLLGGLALLFEEGATRTARLQRRLSGQLKRNMASVWTVAAAVALPAAHATVLTAVLVVYIYLRQQRPAGHQLYRSWFSASTQIICLLVSEAVLQQWQPVWSGVGWALGGSISVMVVIAIQSTVNRSLVVIGLMQMGVNGRVLLGTRDDNLIELATLCLGGLVGIAAVHEPWLCVLVIAPMVTLQRGALVRELETAATVDAKTGLLNAIAWEQLAKREIEHAQRDTKPLAILIIDIDRFKLVNDQYGHLVGDEVLRGVGKVLRAEVREFDTVGRFGGEEFVVVLPDAADADALVVAERLRAKVNKLRVSEIVSGVSVHADDHMAISVGVSCAPAHGIELADLLVCADAALYRAKAAGRNRVMMADRGSGEQFVRVIAG
jgi:diguanylate cyclase (GGDEF)-like protein